MFAEDAARLFEPGRNCWTVARAGRVALIVDGADYFSLFARAAEQARQSIAILAWDFSTNARLHPGPDPPHGPPARLGAFLNWLARRRRGLQIRILEWDYPLVFGTDRQFPPLWTPGRWRPHRRVELAYDNTHPTGGSHHQKIVVIDDALAFIGGFDLTDRRWDTPAHRVDEPGRVCDGVPYPPFHDLMMMVDGPAARALGDIVRDRWLAALDEELPPAAPAGDPWPPGVLPDLCNVDIALSRTLPALGGWPAVREVEALYLDMIAVAQRCIYIENQYFTAASIGDALAARLAEPAGPEIVIVLRLLSHGWLEEHTMHVLRTELIARLRSADRHGRFFLYYADQAGLPEGTCIDIHSKVMIVDDAWLRIGSANLSNRSMGMDSECDATLAAAGDAQAAQAIRAFRNRLLGEHLDAAPAAVDAACRETGSLHGAIEHLATGPRCLRPFDTLPAWSAAVLDLVRFADPPGEAAASSLPAAGDRASAHEALESPRGAAAPVRPKGRGWPLLAAVALIAGLMALWRITPLAELADPREAVALAQEFGQRPWAPWLVVALYTPACLVLFPRPLITLAAVVAFGPVRAAGYGMAGLLLAAWLSYEAGRRLPRHTVRHLAGARLNRIAETLRRRGLVALTALRLVPLAPFAVEGLVAGVLRLPAWKLLLGTGIGILPGTVGTIVFGHQITAALNEQGDISPGLMIAVALALLGLTLFVRRWLIREGGPAVGEADDGRA